MITSKMNRTKIAAVDVNNPPPRTSPMCTYLLTFRVHTILFIFPINRLDCLLNDKVYLSDTCTTSYTHVYWIWMDLK